MHDCPKFYSEKNPQKRKRFLSDIDVAAGDWVGVGACEQVRLRESSNFCYMKLKLQKQKLQMFALVTNANDDDDTRNTTIMLLPYLCTYYHLHPPP